MGCEAPQRPLTTLSCLQDILTDLSAECEDLTLEDVLENGLVHKVCAVCCCLEIISAVRKL